MTPSKFLQCSACHSRFINRKAFTPDRELFLAAEMSGLIFLGQHICGDGFVEVVVGVFKKQLGEESWLDRV